MIKKIVSDKFITAAVFMYVAVGVTSLGNYFYHLLMARMLKPASLLGELESVISFIYILSVPLLTLSLAIVKFVSHYKGRGKISDVNNLYSFIQRKILLFGGVALIVLLILSPIIRSFLHLSSYYLVALLAINFLIGIYTVAGRGILQGLSDFFNFAVSNTSETIAKIIFAVILVSLGFGVLGAFSGMVIGTFVGAAVLFKLLQTFRIRGGVFKDEKAFYAYIVPVFFTILAITSLYSTDIILVRHFFPGNQSGDYAVLSIMGKVIFFAVSPIASVLFPLVSEHHTKGERYDHFFFLAFGLTFVGTLLITGLYFWQGELMISLLPGRDYLRVAPLLGIMGIFMGLYSLCVLMANYYLSIHKTTQVYMVLLAAAFQILGIYFFHQTLAQVIWISITVLCVLLLLLLLYYPYASGKKFV